MWKFGVEILRKGTNFAEFWANRLKLYRNCAFPQNCPTRKLGKNSVFYAVVTLGLYSKDIEMLWSVMCFTVLCCYICFIVWIWILDQIRILIEVICLVYIFYMRWWRRNNGLRGWTDIYFNFRDIVFMCNLTGSCSHNTLYNNCTSWTKIKLKANVEKLLFK